MPPKIVVVGSSNTDLVVKAPRLPRPGETVLGGGLAVAQGGKGANQAVAAARLGAEVTLVARVGWDSFGRAARASFRREGLRTTYIRCDPQAPTGVALIVVDDQGQNLIAVAPGANAYLAPADVEAARRAIAASQVLLAQLEVPQQTVRRALALARQAGATTILNPAPAPAEKPLDEELWPLVDLLTPNEREAQALTGLPVEDLESARQAGQFLLERGVKGVVITLGARGALTVTPSGARLTPAYQVKAVDTTAAGDAFTGGLAYAVASGRPLAEAVEYACAVAALCITKLGAQPSLPYRLEVEGFILTSQAGGV